VMRRILVGSRTGPFTLRRFSLAPLMRSAQTAWGEGQRMLDEDTAATQHGEGGNARTLLQVLVSPPDRMRACAQLLCLSMRAIFTAEKALSI